MVQARESFETGEDLAIAELIVGNLDESGFLTVPFGEVTLFHPVSREDYQRVLETIQTFQPFGIAGRNLRESLLIQLKCLGRADSLAYRVIDEQYENLLHNRVPEIRRALKSSESALHQAVYEEIARLDFHPGSLFGREQATPIIPDVSIEEGEQGLVVVCRDEEYLPNIRLNPHYLKLLEDESFGAEGKEFVRQKVVSAKWLLKNIHHRGTTIERIAYSLLQRHEDFFTQPDGKLTPLTMLAVADELELHESTIARAVANKYINTPRGLFPLRFFFTSSLGSSEGEVSSNTAKDYIIEMIAKEDKKKPLSDSEISKRLKEKGIECSRRTVAKYRGILKLGNAHQRRQF